MKNGKHEWRDGCFSRRAKVRDLLWKLFFTAFRAANESAGRVRAPAPPNLETGSESRRCHCRELSTVNTIAHCIAQHRTRSSPIHRLLDYSAVAPSSCPNSPSAKHSSAQSTRAPSSSPQTTFPMRDPTQQPASYGLLPLTSIHTSFNTANSSPSQSSPASPKATPSAPPQRPPAMPPP